MFSFENKLFCFYFAIPLLVGILLGDYLGFDLSDAATRHIGLLRFIQSAGIDIHTKSVIFALYIVCAPCFWFFWFRHRQLNPPQPDPLKALSNSRLLILIVGALLMGLVFFVVIFIGLHTDALITPDRQTRSLLAWSRWDVSFAFYAGGIIWAGVFCIFAVFGFINELMLRLKNRINKLRWSSDLHTSCQCRKP